jgi:hypothetical protein
MECGLYGFSLTQIALLMLLTLTVGTYAMWEHRKQVREERDANSDHM